MSLTCLLAGGGGSELMRTGDLEGLHSSGNGLGMDGTEEESESALALKINIKQEITTWTHSKQRRRVPSKNTQKRRT